MLYRRGIMIMPTDPVAIEKANFCALVERFHDNSDPRKLGAVSQALMDVICYATDHNIVVNGQEFPEDLKIILTRVFVYLGDYSE
jgi:hypothetical protein